MTAKIVTDSGGGPVVGSAILLGSQVGTPVLLTNLDNTGVSGWRWEIIDAPPESPTLYPLPAPVFTASHSIANDVKGQCVLVRLTTYLDVARTQLDDVDQVIIGVRFDPPFDWLIPAAGQTLESNQIRGWAQDVNEVLREVHEFIEGGTSSGAPRLIDGGATRTIPENFAVLFRDEIKIRSGELRVRGELKPVNVPRHFMPTQVPARTRLIVPVNEVVHFSGVLPVNGVLTVRGLLKDISPPPLDGQDVLDALTAIAPNTPSILGVASPTSFLLPATVRSILSVYSQAETDAEIAAAILANPTVDLDYLWWNTSSNADGSFVGSDTNHSVSFSAELNRVNKWLGSSAGIVATLPVVTSADHNRMVAFFESGDSSSNTMGIVASGGATFRFPGSGVGGPGTITVQGARSIVVLQYDHSTTHWSLLHGWQHVLGAGEPNAAVWLSDGVMNADELPEGSLLSRQEGGSIAVVRADLVQSYVLSRFVTNPTGSPLTRGMAVSMGGNDQVQVAVASGSDVARKFIGAVRDSSIAAGGGQGLVQVEGPALIPFALQEGTAWGVGDQIYLSDVSNAYYTNVMPTASGSWIVPIGRVVSAPPFSDAVVVIEKMPATEII